MHFREARPDDRLAMTVIYHRCVAEADWMSEAMKARADFDRDTEGERLFVVECGGEVLGFVSVWEPDSFIHLLFVQPESRGCGVGSLLLDQLQTHVPPPWRLKCTAANEHARQFYLSRGWNPVEIGGESAEEKYWLMEWTGVMSGSA